MDGFGRSPVGTTLLVGVIASILVIIVIARIRMR